MTTPFNPSIKFEPLMTIKMQKLVNITLIKTIDSN